MSYQTPAGGWQYIYEGTFTPGVADTSFVGGVSPAGFGGTPAGGNTLYGLDGTWQHDQGDKWDGTAPGDPLSNPAAPINPNDASPANLLSGSQGTSPGGAGRFIDTDGRDYIRIQDAGNPENHGWVQGLDPNYTFPPGTPHEPINTNRRVYFGHDMTPDFPGGYDQLVMDNGITISFRARIPNAGPLDNLYTGTTTTPVVSPWVDPTTSPNGRGTLLMNGRGVLNVVQNDFANFDLDSLIGFSLITSTDIQQYKDSGGAGSITSTVSGGFIMNNLSGNTPDNNTDSTTPGTLNIIPMSDASLNQWHEFWITIQDNGAAAGTHQVKVYVDGSLTPMMFNVTASGAGNSGYAKSQSAFLEMGISDNDRWGSIDVDFFSYKLGLLTPEAAPVEDADFDNNGVVDGTDFLIWQRGFGITSGASNGQGDANGNGAVDAVDLNLWKVKFGGPPAVAAGGAVPEPGTGLLMLGGALAASRFRRIR